MKIHGSCHCGFITFEGEADPARAGVCHCSDCQTSTGSAFRTNVPVAGAAFKMLTGEPTVYVKTTAESGNPRAQAFCPKCGSPIYSTTPGTGPKEIYIVRIGTLRERDLFVPKVQSWARSAQPWTMQGLADVKRFEKASM
jgi:hypothetical protein